MTAFELKSWKRVVTPHDDILRGELEMSTYAADLAAVRRRDSSCPQVYRDARLFYESTYLTQALRSLLKDVMSVLCGGAGDRVLQLRTPFGGGKTHSLVALYHLAASRSELRGLPDLADLPNPGATDVIVLSGTELDPTTGRMEHGRVVRTLWGELAAQIGGPEAYNLVEEQDETRVAPGGEVVRRLLQGKPKLILLDEVLVYVAKAMGIALHDSSVGRQVLVFLQTLTEVVRGLPNVAMVYSLQASVGEAVGEEGLLADLDHLVSRVDAKREPVSGDEVMRVVQRRLFKSLGDPAVHREVAARYAELFRRVRKSMSDTSMEGAGADRDAEVLQERALASYPFHPDLLDLMYHRWGTLASYQRTRGALQFLATVVHAAWNSAAAGEPLIGPGDVTLDDSHVRSAFFSQVGQREPYTAALNNDLIGTAARVHEVDRRVAAESPALVHRRLGTRLATAIMLYSFGARSGDDRGVLEHELIASCLAPGLDRPVLATALADLREQLLYLHYTGRRYRFETQPNLNMLVGDEARKWQPDEVKDRVEAELKQRVIATKGKAYVWPDDIPDKEPSFIVAYMGPDWAARPLEFHAALVREQVENGNRRFYRNGLAIAVPGRQPMDKAMQAARTLMGLESLIKDRTRFRLSDEQVEQLLERRRTVQTELDSSLRRLYEFVYLPVPARSGDEAYAIERLDLRVRRETDIHGRVLEALEHHVFERVTDARLITLTRLGQPDGDGNVRHYVSCRQVVEWFFTVLDFSKVYDLHTIRLGVAEGVHKGTIGYVAAGRIDEKGEFAVDNPAHVRLGQAVPPGEIDLLSPGAYLLTPDLAARSRRASPAPADRETPLPAGVDAAGPGLEASDGGQTKLMPSAGAEADARPGPGEAGRRYILEVSADKASVFQVWQAIEALSDQADTLEVTITVRAESSRGIDPVWLRNAVEELLTEREVHFKGRLES